jgi:hypothetical protein
MLALEIIGGFIALLILFAVITNIKGLIRYIKISNM